MSFLDKAQPIENFQQGTGGTGFLSKARPVKKEPEASFRKKTQSILGTVFGGEKVGEAIGTGVAKFLASPEERKFIEKGPSAKQVAGSAIRSASLFAPPVGRIASFARKGKTALGGLVRGAGAGATTGAGVGVVQGAGFGMEKNEDLGGIAKQAVKGAGIGALTGGVLGGVAGGITGKITASRNLKEETIKLIQGSPDSRVAKYKISGEGKIVKDKVAQEAIKQGMDEGVVAVTKGSSSADKLKMREMLDILEKRKTQPIFGATNRSSDVIGKSFMERFNVVSNANKVAGKQIDVVAKSLRGQKVDPMPAVQGFMDELEDLGVTFKKGTPVYRGSQIEGLTEPQKIINTIVNRMKNVSDDAFEIHNLKKFIDEQVSYGKTTGGLSGRTANILKSLRRDLDGMLDNNFDEYDKVNTVFSTTKEALDDFVASAGAKFDPLAPNASKQVGTLARRILSNAPSRINVLNAMNKIQEVAITNGGKFSDDIITQTVFMDDLERLFGTQAPTSLSGEVSKGIQKVTGVASKLKSAQGLTDIALEGAGVAVEKVQNINREGLIKAIRALLSTN